MPETTLDRLARAFSLTVAALGGGRYQVTGGSAPNGHTVTILAGEQVPTCSCRDSRTRVVCKHSVAVLLTQAPAALVVELAKAAGVEVAS